MIRSLQVADECYEPYAQVTYDLAIAKIAFQLQITEKPRFDRVFIHLGMFHVMMAYFKSVGKFIDKSGLTSIMVDSGLLAEGSVNSFLTGKHFNRCKRLHPLVALSLEILLFRSFLEDENVIISESVNDYLEDFANNRSKNPKIENDSLNKLFEDYEMYKEKTINGDKGKTAQYFAIYINIIHYYFMLNRSIRTADFELLKFVLPKITNLFFVFNQQNYSRYSVLYLDNLLQVDITHPGLNEKFLAGSFGIKRTSKPFSRQPIDLTLEQTINADAANKLTGIVHSTNSLSARQRWCINHSTRTKIITHVVEYCGLKRSQDVTADLGKSQIKKSAMQINNFLLGIESSINPFQSDLEKNDLFNISTGRAASQESELFLLNIENSGNKLREKFIEECALKEERFESPIKKNKVCSFMGTEKKKIKIGTKITEVKMQRDLFGKLLAISLGKALDFEKALSYPLTPVPLAFCHIDGGICKTNKAMLLKKLESEVNHSMPPKIDVMIVDGFFLLHTMENLPLTFRNISKQILQAVLRTSASTVILSFDQYFTKSIKDTEHFLRGTTRGKQYQLLGPEQARPPNFRNELKNINFKEALIKFLIKDWENNEMAHYIGNKTLYVNAETCVKFECINDKVLKSDESRLSCPEHEESDTKMVFHACKVEKGCYVVIRCSDADILMIMLGNMEHVKEKVNIWIDAGTGKYRRFINVTKLYEKLGSALCSALPAFHAFTGCDFNPSFYRKGKLKPFNILRKNTNYIKTFSDLSLYPDCDLTAIISGVEIYVCEMYGLRNIKELNKARVEMFFKTYRCKKKEKTLDINVRNFDGSSLPPCKSEIIQHALRSAYIGSIWCNAHKQSLSDLLPEDCGWEETEGKLSIKWFHGEQLPNISEDILFQEESDDESTEEASQLGDNLSNKILKQQSAHQSEESTPAIKSANVAETKLIPDSASSPQIEDNNSLYTHELNQADINKSENISQLRIQQLKEQDCPSNESMALTTTANLTEEEVISELTIQQEGEQMSLAASQVNNIHGTSKKPPLEKEYIVKSSDKEEGRKIVSSVDPPTTINCVTKEESNFLTSANEKKRGLNKSNISRGLPLSLNGIEHQQVEQCQLQHMQNIMDAVIEYDGTGSATDAHLLGSNELDIKQHQQSAYTKSSCATTGKTETRATMAATRSKESTDLTGSFKSGSDGNIYNNNNTDITDIIPNNNISIITGTEYNISSEDIAKSDPQQSPISYNEGQWSPMNPTGKKQYDREQLLLLRDVKASRRQPDVNNVSILPTPNLLPSFVRNTKRVQSMVGSLNNKRSATSSVSGVDTGCSYVNKQSSVHGRGSIRGMIRVNLSLNQDVKLSETDNAWRPRVLEKDGYVVEDPEAKIKREKDELIRRVRGILNKLTPEKFDTLVEEIIKLKIDTPDKMEDVMVLVFEKAIDEPNFSVSYARLCHRLITEVKARDERMESGTKTNLAQFRAALLDKTEREFTQNVTKSKAKEKKLQPIMDKISNCTDPTEKAELEAQLEEEERKIRRRSGGTVRFIGELFKISMLTGKIINSCIDALLNPNSEDQLECLCKLLTTVGAKFEQTPINMKESTRCYSLEKTVSRMQAIAGKTDKEGARVSSRVRFMLQDVIDLRREKWQSKRYEAPKTMGQVEKEMKKEQLFNYAGSASVSSGGVANSSSALSGGKRDERGGRFNDLRSGYGGSNSQRSEASSSRRQQVGNNSGHGIGNEAHANSSNDDNTWHVQTGKGNRCLDTNKLEGLTTPNNFDTKKMGGVSQFIWSTGTRQSTAPTLTPMNSFAALSSTSDTNRNNERDRSGPRNKGSFHKGSTERDRYGLHSRSGSSQTSRESSSSRPHQFSRSALGSLPVQKSSNISKHVPQISSNKITSKTASSASGLLHPQDGIDTYSINPQAGHISNEKPMESPTAVLQGSSEADIKVIKSLVSDMLEVASNYKTLRNSIEPCIQRIKEGHRSALLYYIMTEYLHLRHIGQLQRRYLGNIIGYLLQNNFISREHFILAYKEFCEVASDLALDIPDLWKYIVEFTGPLVNKSLLTIYDLWNKQLKEDNGDNFGKKFLKTFLDYCLTEIGPSFTRAMFKNTNVQWSDFMTETEIKSFKELNKYEYIEDESIQPKIAANEPQEDAINRVLENVQYFLNETATADQIIDYINGNFVEVDKQFIRNLAAKLCDFAISYKDNSYKLETDCFQKICIPILHRYIDSKEEYELECLYSLQLLVARLEHPRGLLSDLFGELYDADVIPQDSFIKWRDSKDQSAGKGVAVKGLNPFFNHVLNSETSDENN